MKNTNKFILLLVLISTLAGCKGGLLGIEPGIAEFNIKNQASSIVKTTTIQLDDGGMGKVNIFDTINSGKIIINDSAKLKYSFKEANHGEGKYRMTVELESGKILKKDFGYFDSSLNPSVSYECTIDDSNITVIEKIIKK
jgi:hypothetical protein